MLIRLLFLVIKLPRRHSEHDVLMYVMDSAGKLNPKEIP